MFTNILWVNRSALSLTFCCFGKYLYCCFVFNDKNIFLLFLSSLKIMPLEKYLSTMKMLKQSYFNGENFWNCQTVQMVRIIQYILYKRARLFTPFSAMPRTQLFTIHKRWIRTKKCKLGNGIVTIKLTLSIIKSNLTLEIYDSFTCYDSKNDDMLSMRHGAKNSILFEIREQATKKTGFHR